MHRLASHCCASRVWVCQVCLCVLFVWVWMPGDAMSAPASSLKIALIIGHNHGGPALPLLRFAQRDAQRLAALLVELGGFRDKQIELLQAPTVEQVRAAMQRIRKRAIASKRRAVFFFYYSGHAAQEHFQLGSQTLPFVEVLRFSRLLPVRVRVMVVDSCYSGRFLRIKGARRQPSMKWLPQAQVRTHGLAILTSSEASGRSYESDRIQGSLFTSSLLAGMRGAADKDKDQRISLAELQSYVYQKTLGRSASQASEVQRPSHRLELQGQGALFLTQLDRAPARLIFARSDEGHFFLYRGAGLVQDFHKAQGEHLQVGLQAGSYRLRVRRHGWLGDYDFQVAKAQPHRVKAAHFRWKQLSVQQQFKGGPGSSAPVGIGASLHYNPVANLSQHRLGILLGFDSGRWLRIGAGYRYGASNQLALPYQTHTMSLRLAVGYGFGHGPFGFWLGVHIDPALLVRTSPTDLLINAGFATGLLCHLDYYLAPTLALRIVASGGMELLLFAQNFVRISGNLDVGVGFVWRP